MVHSVKKKNIKWGLKRLAQYERFWWFCKQTSFEKTIPGLCFADHSVCWIHAKKRVTFKGKMSDQSAHSLLFPHSIELIYLIAASDTHYLSDASVDASNLTQKKSSTYVAEWLYYCSCSANRSPHEAKRERVGEERTKPASPTHTSLLSNLKELLYSPTWRGAKAMCPAKNKLTFIDRVRRLFGKEELRCCFWTEDLAHKHSACKAEKHGNGIMLRWRGSWTVFWSAYGASNTDQKGFPSYITVSSSRFHNICAVIAYF